jgi:hypothetical protein
MRKLLFAALLAATPAVAQQPTQYTLRLAPNELQTVLDALTDIETMPWKKTNPVIATLVQQMRAQQAVAAQPVPPPSETHE